MSSPGRIFDCSDLAQRAAGIDAAAAAVGRGELVVLPTDTVYGIGADAFTPAAVTALLAAKGRGRSMPPPVLVGSVRAAAALIDDLGMHGIAKCQLQHANCRGYESAISNSHLAIPRSCQNACPRLT